MHYFKFFKVLLTKMYKFSCFILAFSLKMTKFIKKFFVLC